MPAIEEIKKKAETLLAVTYHTYASDDVWWVGIGDDLDASFSVQDGSDKILCEIYPVVGGSTKTEELIASFEFDTPVIT